MAGLSCAVRSDRAPADAAQVLNTKFPEIGELLLHRLLKQWVRAYTRNDKPIILAVSKFIAHLVNQQVPGPVAWHQTTISCVAACIQQCAVWACSHPSCVQMLGLRCWPVPGLCSVYMITFRTRVQAPRPCGGGHKG
jgi:hypothetical protein